VFNHSGPPRRRVVFLSGVVPVLATALLAIYRPPLFARLDDAAYDVVVRSAGTRLPAGRVAIVNVDERSLATVGQWPWRRDVMGRLIRSLHAAGAAVVAIDVIFAESDRYDGEHGTPSQAAAAAPDQQLAAALGGSGAVLGYGLTFEPGGVPAYPCVMHPLAVALVQPPGEEAADPFFRASGAVCNIPALAKAAPRSGFLNAVPDADGILRRVPLLAGLDGRV
jgi:CHASE2 domain-containing sensor protein